MLTCFFAYSAQAQLYPDRHTTSPDDAWKSCTEAMNPNGESGMSHWIKFDFESIEDISDIKIWNLNDPASLTDGISTLRVDYSTDNVNWTFGGEFTVPISDGSAFYEGEIVGTLNGAQARYIILTGVENHGGTCFGISEARFYLGQSVPVELLSFEANCDEGISTLEWSFGDISDFESLDVERSSDGTKWEKIYSTASAGSKDGDLITSSYTDASKHIGAKNYYRLKMYDINGVYEYSNTVLNTCEFTDQDVTIYPQPVQAEMTINMELTEASQVEYTTLNILGQQMDKNVWDASEGMNQFTLDVSRYVDGQYIIQFDINGTTIEKKFVKN